MRYDDRAIVELRRLKLLWGSFGEAERLDNSEIEWPVPGWSFRRLKTPHFRLLRLFFLSLLWRAAITQLPGFSSITLSDIRLEVLRRMVAEGDPEPQTIFPTTLTQVTTRGPWHNATPTADYVTYEAVDEVPEQRVRAFRFYFDGLIARIDDEETDTLGIDRWGSAAVGRSTDLFVMARPFEGSRQSERIEGLIRKTEKHHLEVVARIFGRSRN
ncbi:hypothetical protein LB533_03425 [Mesorhizobium sp. BR1-1-13]|uniref:hypothetical protein n=1 Tax=Mesorhizobium sp. BR1-1-13 TaxID=2876656 RepID=UPI001CD060D7|nr:hypothetical protein [Mesorhizobium sp. BR1-1-13]MBZ9940150.1 hypothetical protein [Mesorhizobium sp. BR1-1-13]